MIIETEPSKSYVAFCGIARPHGFFAALRDAGVKVVAERAFRDHHAYSEEDISKLLEMRGSSGAVGFVTTEKDQINLGAFADRLAPISFVKLNVSVERAEELVTRVMEVAASRTSKAAKS